MGVVLKAFDPALDRQVAIKVMAAAVAGSATARRRFTREAKAAAAVCHEHIVPVHGVHEEDGLPYLVMQYVAGESLQSRLDRTGPLEIVEIVQVGLQTALGLAAAHARGLIHRDVKPANLLLQATEEPLAKPRSGKEERQEAETSHSQDPPASSLASLRLREKSSPVIVKITDFGLARMIDDVALTQAGLVAGTPEYMAPEQSRGESLDSRADLFSLGSVMYAMSTGLPPFRASTVMGVIHKLNEELPTPIRELNANVPAWLEAFIARLMEKDPHARFHSAAEAAELLEGYLAHLRQPSSVPAPDLTTRPSGIIHDRLVGEEKRAGLAHRLRDSMSSILSRSGGLITALVVAIFGFTVLGFAALMLGVINPEQNPDEERRPVMPPAEKVDVWSIAVSKEANIVAAGAGMWDRPGEIGVWDLTTHQPLQHIAEYLGVGSIALSPDGKLLATGSWGGHVRVWDWAAGKQRFDFPAVGGTRVAFSPDGKLLAIVTEDKTAQLWDMENGKLAADLQGDLLCFHCVTFSPDGRQVLAGGGDWNPGGINQVTIWDVASKKQVLKLVGHQNAILSICFSPDGKTIATGSVDNTIRLWDAESGKHRKSFRGHSHWVEGLAFSADGKTLVSGCLDHTIRFWDVGQGKEIGRITMKVEVCAVCFAPDGETLFAGGGAKTLKRFAVATHEERATLWNGSDPLLVAMDRLPFLSSTMVQERGWLLIAGLLGFGPVLVVSLSFAVWFTRRRRGVEQPPAGANPATGSMTFPCSACGKSLKCKAELAGKNVKCPRCHEPTFVPRNIESQPPVAGSRRWWTRTATLIAFAVTGIFVILLFVGLVLLSGNKEPYVSRLQPLSERVKSHQTDTIDARPFPTVADRDLYVLTGLDHLRNLILDHTAITDSGLKNIALADKLTALSLSNTQVSDAGLAELKTLSALEDLRLDKLPLTDEALSYLSAFPRLKKLSLYQTGVTDNGLVYLKQLSELRHLSLDDTKISDEGIRHLSQCAKLRYLSVWRTKVSPAGAGIAKSAASAQGEPIAIAIRLTGHSSPITKNRTKA